MRAKRLMRCVFHLNNALSVRIERQRNSFNMRIEPEVGGSKSLSRELVAQLTCLG
jgi:hypothetical protein